MEVVIRTPHGDADIEIVHAPPFASLADLIAEVTGQAPPPAAHVDGRAVVTSAAIVDLGLRIGSVIDTGSPSTTRRSRIVGPDSPAPTLPPPVVVDSPPAEPAAGAAEPASTSSGPTGRPPADPGRRPLVEITQLTARGAGRTLTLGPGRYRLGPGRRLVAPELDESPVELPAFEVEIDRDGGATVVPGPRAGAEHGPLTPTLGGSPLTTPTTWNDGRLSIGGRVFDLRAARRPGDARDFGPADAMGAIPFHRTPAPPTLDRVLADAEALASGRADGLWGRRPLVDGSLVVPIALSADAISTVDVDLVAERGIAVVGTDEFTGGAVRTLLTMACSTAGPADLSVAVASRHDRLGHWDWAKWLPHARRGGIVTPPALFASPGLMGEWAADLRSDATDRLTVLVVDDRTLWSTRESPLRSVLVDPPDGLRLVVLCSAAHEAHGMCSVVVQEVTAAEALADAGDGASPVLVGSLARVTRPDLDLASVVVRPVLAETDVVTRIARRIAPLDDLADDRSGRRPSAFRPPTLADVLDVDLPADRGVSGADEPDRDDRDQHVATAVVIGHRIPESDAWSDLPPPDAGRAEVSVTRPEAGDDSEADAESLSSGDEPTHSATDASRATDVAMAESSPATLELTDGGSTCLWGRDDTRLEQVVAATVVGACVRRGADRLAVVSLGRRPPAWFDELPHVAGIVVGGSDEDVRRVTHRVERVLAEHGDLRVVIVVEVSPVDVRSTDDGGGVDVELLDSMLALAEDLDRVHVVAIAHDPPELLSPDLRARLDVVVDVSATGDASTITRRDGGVVPFVAVGAVDEPGAGGPLRVRPNVFGRAMTPLERRLVRRRHVTDEVDPIAADVVGLIADRAMGGVTPGLVLPPELPRSISVSRLLASRAGDAVPLGLVDRPETADHDVYWWDPDGSGALVAIGSPRSGMSTIVDLITVGLASRIDPSEVEVHAIEPLPQRRRAFSMLPHVRHVESTDDPVAADRLVAGVEAIARRRRRGGQRRDDPTVLLAIGDLGRLLRWLPGASGDDDGLGASAEDMLGRLADLADGGLGVELLVVASRASELGPLLDAPGDRLIGELFDRGEAERLGAPAGWAVSGQAGRCWSVAESQLVQLATPPRSPERAIAETKVPPESRLRAST